jgi:hypothetical protein
VVFPLTILSLPVEVAPVMTIQAVVVQAVCVQLSQPQAVEVLWNLRLLVFLILLIRLLSVRAAQVLHLVMA